MLPKGQFMFEGQNLLEKYRKEEKSHVDSEYSKMIKESDEELSSTAFKDNRS